MRRPKRNKTPSLLLFVLGSDWRHAPKYTQYVVCSLGLLLAVFSSSSADEGSSVWACGNRQFLLDDRARSCVLLCCVVCLSRPVDVLQRATEALYTITDVFVSEYTFTV